MTTPSQTGPDRDVQNAGLLRVATDRVIAASSRFVSGLITKKNGGDAAEAGDAAMERRRGRVPTLHHLEKKPKSGRFAHGAFWCLNRAGLGHVTNEDGQYYDLDRELFVSVDGISNGGNGRSAAQAFLDVLEDHCGDPGKRGVATPDLLDGVVRECAETRLDQNGVDDGGGLVYAAVEFLGRLPDGKEKIRVYAQGDVIAWAFSVTEDGKLAGIRRLTVPHRLDEASSTVTNCVAPGWAGKFSYEDWEVSPGEYVALCSDGVSDTLDEETVSKMLSKGHRKAPDGTWDDAAMDDAVGEVDEAVIVRMLHAANEEMGVLQRVRRDAAGIVSSGKKDNYNLILIRYDGAPEEQA